MLTHDLTQGTPEWVAHRATHFNASDAPAMMGCSPYKTRTELLHGMHTGLAAEVNSATQRRFDDGHRFEALARPLAAAIIGEALFPVTGSEGKLSASFDGLTMDESIAFEHKSLNDELRGLMPAPEMVEHEPCNAIIPKHYRVQMQQQCMVSGASRVLFMATKWDGDTLVEARHCWYESDAALAAEITAGWAQFEIDLAAYAPQTATAETTGKRPDALPALHIEVTGMVTASNLDSFKSHALGIFGSINRELVTDNDFANAEQTVKWCADVEDRLAAAKQHALSQTASIDELFSTIDDISAEARRVRLELDKLVKSRKESIRGEIVADGVKTLAKHIDALNARLGKTYMPISLMGADFAGAIKGKRTVDSIRDAVSTTLANAKIAANAAADKIQINLAYLQEDVPQGHAFLFADLSTIVLKANDDFRILVDSRIAEHKAKKAQEEADTRERIRTEELARIEREQAAAAKKVIDDAAAAAKAAEPPAAAPVPVAATAPAANVVTLPTPQENAARILAARLPERPATPPTLKLGAIAERLGFALTGDFLKSLGFEPAARDKAALLFHESDFPLICMRLVSHIQNVQAKQAA